VDDSLKQSIGHGSSPFFDEKIFLTETALLYFVITAKFKIERQGNSYAFILQN